MPCGRKEDRLKLGILCENFNNWRSGVDTALYVLLLELRQSCDITVFAAWIDPACLIPGIRFVRIPTILTHLFLLQLMSSDV